MSNEQAETPFSMKNLFLVGLLGLGLLWLAQPPGRLWPLAFVALVPWLHLVVSPNAITRRGYGVLWIASTLYWLITLQGLRHAHPAMYLCWIALSGYLAVYHLMFLCLVRRTFRRGWALVFTVPIIWVAQECLRNYLLTGISAVMLGHSMADTPILIQIADVFGTYGVSFVIALVNVAAFQLWRYMHGQATLREGLVPWLAATIALLLTAGYGWMRLREPVEAGTTTFALLQRDEEVVYGQSIEREVEMFRNYARQAADSVAESGAVVDAVVWPESMFTGGNPWVISNAETVIPPDANITRAEFDEWAESRRQGLLQNARYVQLAIAASNNTRSPHLLAGCGIVEYLDEQNVYSGVVNIGPDHSLQGWYGKTHLVMFGEYIPIAPHIPGLKSLIPPGLGLKVGPGPKSFQVGDSSVAANICIETAVERVTVNQLADLRQASQLPDAIVTVTNDGWFDHSSVIDHHLRCAQLVAVGIRRPILSAANNGPTAWIDSCGQLVERLPTGQNGAVIAAPSKDERVSLYLTLGDWPARVCVLLCGFAFLPRRSKNDS